MYVRVSARHVVTYLEIQCRKIVSSCSLLNFTGLLIVIQFNKTALFTLTSGGALPTLSGQHCRQWQHRHPSTVAWCHSALNNCQLTSCLDMWRETGLTAYYIHCVPPNDLLYSLHRHRQLQVYCSKIWHMLYHLPIKSYRCMGYWEEPVWMAILRPLSPGLPGWAGTRRN